MGDFGQGVDLENNMLSEMSQRNDNIAQHYADQVRGYNTQLEQAKEEAGKRGRAELESLRTPQKMGEELTQVTQVGQRAAAARGVFKNVYGSNMYKYATNLGRTGDETTLGVRPLGQAISKGVGMVRARGTGGFTPGAISEETASRSLADTPTESLLGDSPSVSASPELSNTLQEASDRFTPPATTSSDPAPQASSGEGGSAPEGAAVSEGTAAESSTGVPAVENMTTRGAASTATAATEGSTAAAEGLGSAAKAGLSTAADLGAKAGVGLGIIGGASSLAQDFSGGHFHLAGDNGAEKAGNAMSMASGALDTLGLVAPPLAIIGGILGVGSAIADIFGHVKHSSEPPKPAAPPPPPPKPIQESVASTAVGQVASQGADTLHSIAGTAF
jgi:hypothetical protein